DRRAPDGGHDAHRPRAGRAGGARARAVALPDRPGRRAPAGAGARAEDRGQLPRHELRGAAGAAAHRRGQPDRGVPAGVARRRARGQQPAGAGAHADVPLGPWWQGPAMTVSAPELLRPPAPGGSEIARFLDWLRRERGLAFDGYDELHRWSVEDLEGFWSAVAEFYAVRFATPPERVLGRREMPGAEWFPGATLNYAEHLLPASGETAVVARSRTREPRELSFDDLRDQVARARAGLQRLGVAKGDRVVACLPNIPETLAALLACASLGAIWASVGPEFGPRSVTD